MSIPVFKVISQEGYVYALFDELFDAIHFSHIVDGVVIKIELDKSIYDKCFDG